MDRTALRRAALLAGGFIGIWLFLKYLLPLFLPFGVGLLLALAAEPAVRLGVKWKLPRWASAGLGVSLTLLLFVTLVGVIGAATVKELGVLARQLPDLQDTAQEATLRLRNLMENAATYVPDGIRPLVDRSINGLFTSGSAFLEQGAVGLPSAITSFLSRIPDGALGIGTGLISGFMFSARLPKLKTWLAGKMPPKVKTQLLPALKRGKDALFGWLKAQLKLSSITCGIVLVGLLLLRIPFAPVWAVGIALVDAVPLLGTGIVLVPWALISLMQQQPLRAVGLLCTYACAVITRTVLEPRLVGRHLGLDPLVTLVFLYLGYRFWGIFGMLLSPMLVAAITATAKEWNLSN